MKKICWAVLMTSAFLAAPVIAADTVFVAGYDGMRSAPPVPPYAGPPLTDAHYRIGYFTQGLCMAVFAQHVPVVLAISRVVEAEPLIDALAPDYGRAVQVDPKQQTVTVTVDGFQRTSRFYDSNGCAILPPDRSDIYASLPKSADLAPASDPSKAKRIWPQGEMVDGRVGQGVDLRRLTAATNAFFDHGKTTDGLVVVHGGRIVAERYRAPYSPDTYFQSWSAGKSLLSTLLGVLVEKGDVNLDAPAPITLWHEDKADPRNAIRVRDLLQMSSGLRFSTSHEPRYTWRLGGTSDHGIAYKDAINAYDFAIKAPLEMAPGTAGQYHNSDMWALGLIAKQAAAKRGEHLRTFLQRELYDPLGIPGMLTSTDAYGNIVFSGMNNIRARDWARIGQLYLQRGQWNGRQIIPASYADFVKTPAPAWLTSSQADWARSEGKVYGGGFWVVHSSTASKKTYVAALPDGSFYAWGGLGAALIFVIPSRDLVIVRMGGDRIGGEKSSGAEMLYESELRDFLPPLLAAFGNDAPNGTSKP